MCSTACRLTRSFDDGGGISEQQSVKRGEKIELLVQEVSTSKMPPLNLREVEGLCLEEVVAEAQQSFGSDVILPRSHLHTKGEIDA